MIFFERQIKISSPEQVAIFIYQLFGALYYIDYLYLIPPLFNKYIKQIELSDKYSDNYLPIYYYTKLAYIQSNEIIKAESFLIPKPNILLLSSIETNAKMLAEIEEKITLKKQILHL